MKRAVLVGAAAMVAACGPDPDCGLRVCDIRKPGCQRDVARATACLRGEQPVDIPVEVVAYRDYLARNVADAQKTDRAKFALAMRAYALLNLSPRELPVEQAAEQQSWAAAFYSFDKKIVIIDRGEPMESRDQVALLVHEFAHALQDARRQLVPLFDVHAKSYDRSLGVRAVIEGDASVSGDLAEVALFGAEEDDVPWRKVFDRWGNLARARLRDDGAPILVADQFFVYPFGTPMVFEARRQGQLEAIWSEIPQSTRQVRAGFRAAEPAGGPWVEDLGTDAMPALPGSYAVVEANALGAWVLETYLARGGVANAASVASRLRGDVLSIQHDPTSNRVVLCWRLRFDGEASRAAFDAASPTPTRAVGRDAIIMLADPGPPPDASVPFKAVPGAEAAPMMQPAPRGIACPRPLAVEADLKY